jgi:hypothetical protein
MTGRHTKNKMSGLTKFRIFQYLEKCGRWRDYNTGVRNWKNYSLATLFSSKFLCFIQKQ